MKRNKMLKFNAQVATIKLAQCDLQLKGACSKYEHDADRQRRLHIREVNQLQYDFRIMQVRNAPFTVSVSALGSFVYCHDIISQDKGSSASKHILIHMMGLFSGN